MTDGGVNGRMNAHMTDGSVNGSTNACTKDGSTNGSTNSGTTDVSVMDTSTNGSTTDSSMNSNTNSSTMDASSTASMMQWHNGCQRKCQYDGCQHEWVKLWTCHTDTSTIPTSTMNILIYPSTKYNNEWANTCGAHRWQVRTTCHIIANNDDNDQWWTTTAKNDDDDNNDGSWMAGECHTPIIDINALFYSCANGDMSTNTRPTSPWNANTSTMQMGKQTHQHQPQGWTGQPKHKHATHFECAMLTFLFFLYRSFYHSYIIIYYLFPSLNAHVKSDRNNVVPVWASQKNTILSLRVMVLSLRNTVLSLKNMVLSLRNTVLSLRNIVLSLRYMVLSLRNMVLSLRNMILSLRAMILSLRNTVLSLRYMVLSLRYSALQLFGEFQVQLVSGTETTLYCFVTLLNI